MSREIISNGNGLVARAALDVGCDFFSGYPITPSSEIMHHLSVELPKRGGKFIQMEDEIAGVCAAIGASMSGHKAFTASSGPGISLKSEQIGLSYIAEIPLVIANVMRGGPSTGLPTRVQQGDIIQARNPSHGDMKMIALCPGSLEEAYLQTVKSFNLANRFMQPVFLLMDETLGHMDGKAIIPDLEDIQKTIFNRKVFEGEPKEYLPYGVKEDEPAILNPFFKGFKYHITGLHHGPTGFPTEDAKLAQDLISRLINKVEAHQDEIDEYEEYNLDDADILIIAYGSVSRSAKEAIIKLREEGFKVGMFRPISIWPSPEKALRKVCEKFDKILMIELNMGQYCLEVERIIRKDFIKLLKANGRPISPIEIINKIREI